MEGWRRQPAWSRSQSTSLVAHSLSCSRKMNPGLEQVLWLATALLSLRLMSLISAENTGIRINLHLVTTEAQRLEAISVPLTRTTANN